MGGPGDREVRDHLSVVAPDLPIKYSVAAFRYQSKSPVQSVIHAFKYAGMPRLATVFGCSIADILPPQIDCIVPVPLHRTRLAERGYNQAEALARGLATDYQANVIRATKRIKATPSQTKLSISERIENVRGAFALTRSASKVVGKHLLVVDDVMTTGSTVASVAETLLEAKPTAISILTLAIAEGTL